jgi:Binding domain of DNA repair protein Ercc1 (rad10/Swi10)
LTLDILTVDILLDIVLRKQIAPSSTSSNEVREDGIEHEMLRWQASNRLASPISKDGAAGLHYRLLLRAALLALVQITSWLPAKRGRRCGTLATMASAAAASSSRPGNSNIARSSNQASSSNSAGASGNRAGTGSGSGSRDNQQQAQPQRRPRPQITGQGGGSTVLVNAKQRGNPVLQAIKNVGWEYGDIVPDYQVGVTACVLFLRCVGPIMGWTSKALSADCRPHSQLTVSSTAP